MEEPGGKKCPGWQFDMTKPFWTRTRNLPVLAAGELFMGGYAGPVILMASDLI